VLRVGVPRPCRIPPEGYPPSRPHRWKVFDFAPLVQNAVLFGLHAAPLPDTTPGRRATSNKSPVIAERLRFPTNQTQQAYERYHGVAIWSRVVVTKKPWASATESKMLADREMGYVAAARLVSRRPTVGDPLANRGRFVTGQAPRLSVALATLDREGAARHAHFRRLARRGAVRLIGACRGGLQVSY